MAETRLALIGAGVIGRRHLAALTACPKAKLAAVADPNPAAEPLARERGARFFADAKEMLAAVRPDGVIVATPTEAHLAPVLAALDAGAHVLVEKPVTATVKEAAELVARAKATGRHVLVGHQRRYYDCVRRAREIVQGGGIGRLVAVSGLWASRKNVDYYAPDWRKRRAAGPVLTNLIHEIDYLRHICGEIESVAGETSNHVQGFEKEDVAAVVLRFAGGAIGTFALTDQACSPWTFERATGESVLFPKTGQNAIRFVGTEGALDFPNLVLWKTADDRCDWNTQMKALYEPTKFSDAYAAQLRHFCEVIHGMAEPLIPAEDAARSLAATVAVFESAETGRRVAL